jgi:hypothetical protein
MPWPRRLGLSKEERRRKGAPDGGEPMFLSYDSKQGCCADVCRMMRRREHLEMLMREKTLRVNEER